MESYNVKTRVLNDGVLTIKGLPFKSGEQVEIIIKSQNRKEKLKNAYSLRGKPFRYIDPFNSVAEDDWEALH